MTPNHEPMLSCQTPRQARLHVASFNGTWAGGVMSSHKTVVAEFVKLIADHENVFETPVNGVGSDVSWVDRAIGGIGGWGTLRNVITAFKNIAQHYKPDDRIILTGYSRGAWAARYLAMLINVIGLPKDGDAKLFHDVYKACDKGTMFDTGVAEKVLEGYECWSDVRINALCCFDTVGSLGVPLTGIARPLAVLSGWKEKKPDIISTVAPNVDHSFHCLSLHEMRGPYSSTLMRGLNVQQVSFPGGHRNLGRIEETEGLVHAPFAWMIQQVHTHLNICFDEAKLAARFPSYRPSSIPDGKISTLENGSAWYHGRSQHISSGLLVIIGKEARKPGYVNCPGGATDLKVHIGARLRNDVDDATVPGYMLMAPVTGMPYWAARRVHPRLWSWRSSDSDSISSLKVRSNKNRSANSWLKTADRIEEAEVGALEARLLGLPDDVVLHRDLRC